MKSFTNVFEFSKEMKGKWNEGFFQNQNPVVLELACGGGEYAVALARKFPDKNFIGVDIKGARMFKGALIATEEKISNVAFLRINIDHIEEYFERNEVSEIWITFPDPFLRDAKWKKRLTSSLFLNRYKNILKTNAFIHLKTDSPELYDFTMRTIEEMKLTLHFQTDDVYMNMPNDEILSIKTFYEQMHLAKGKTIKYVRFSIS